MGMMCCLSVLDPASVQFCTEIILSDCKFCNHGKQANVPELSHCESLPIAGPCRHV